MAATSNTPAPQPGRAVRTRRLALGLLGFAIVVLLSWLVWRGRRPTPLSEVPAQELVSIWSEDGRGQPCHSQPDPAADAQGTLPDTTLAIRNWSKRFIEDEWGGGHRNIPPEAIWYRVRTANGTLCWVRKSGLLGLEGALSIPRGRPSDMYAREQTIRRARRWIAAQVPYGVGDILPGNNRRDGYRTDAAGFVSYAWKLRADDAPYSVTAAQLSDHTREIDPEALAPGDALNNQRSGKAGRVAIFVGWRGPDKRAFEAFEMNRDHGKAVHTVLTLVELPGSGWTIAEYEADAPGPYVAQQWMRASD